MLGSYTLYWTMVNINPGDLARQRAETPFYDPFYEGDAHPGPQIQSSKEMVEFIRNNLQTMFHPVGTCKMGHDDLAVVDEQLRVYGVQGLRVVDAYHAQNCQWEHKCTDHHDCGEGCRSASRSSRLHQHFFSSSIEKVF